MDIQWFRDLSITVMGFAGALAAIVGMIVLISLQRKLSATLRQLKEASLLARDAAEVVRDGVQPMVAIVNFFRAAGQRTERSREKEQKRRR